MPTDQEVPGNPLSTDDYAPGSGTPVRSPDTHYLNPANEGEGLGCIGPYRILRVVGSGAMGIVYETMAPQSGERLALKMMLPNPQADGRTRLRFEREVESIRRIKHPRIVQVSDSGTHRHEATSIELPFFTMPMLSGETLERRVCRTGPLPHPLLIKLGMQVAEGLRAVHQEGVIHRDIKPANIWLADSDLSDSINDISVILLDFGLVFMPGSPRVTAPGVGAGTPLFRAPEQTNGNPVPASDLFSLGCVLYYACTGRPPFTGETLESLAQAMRRPPQKPSMHRADTPRGLERVILRLVKWRWEDRYLSSAEVLAALGECAGNSGGVASSPRKHPTRGILQRLPVEEQEDLLALAATELGIPQEDLRVKMGLASLIGQVQRCLLPKALLDQVGRLMIRLDQVRRATLDPDEDPSELRRGSLEAIGELRVTTRTIFQGEVAWAELHTLAGNIKACVERLAAQLGASYSSPGTDRLAPMETLRAAVGLAYEELLQHSVDLQALRTRALQELQTTLSRSGVDRIR